MMARGWQQSGEPLPEMTPPTKAQLERRLDEIGIVVVTSPDRANGWEDAFNAIASAFEEQGAHLSPRQIAFDVPNMLFNFALRCGWFPHLTLKTEWDTQFDLPCPERIPYESFCTTGGSAFHEVHNKRQQLGWFKDRIRPAVIAWNLKAPMGTSRGSTQTPSSASNQITPVQAVIAFKKRYGLTWKQLGQACGISEGTLRNRICNPDWEKPNKKETLESLAAKIKCEWSDLNYPRKNQPILAAPSAD